MATYISLLLFLFSYHTCYGHQGPTPAQALLGYSPTPGTPAPIHLYTPKGFAPSPSPFPEAASPLPPNVAFVTPSPVPIHGPTAFVTPAPLPVHGPVGYIPPQQEYHGHCDSRIAPYCANVTGLHYCLEDPQYPEYDLKLAISQDYLFEKKFSDVVDQSANDLVESISAKEEYMFDYTTYTGASKGPSPYDATHWIGPEGYLCPSEVIYATPKRARNVNGEWRVIVNGVLKYSQTARFETCLFPDSACRLLAPCYQSKCTQKHVYHRMLAFDPCDPYKGVFIDVFKFASACSCHVAQH